MDNQNNNRNNITFLKKSAKFYVIIEPSEEDSKELFMIFLFFNYKVIKTSLYLDWTIKVNKYSA